MTKKESVPYKKLCTEFYELDKPHAPEDALNCYLQYAKESNGPILEPMCGSGRFLIPLLEHGYSVTGFDYSPDMLNVCRKKCEERGLTAHLFEATFESFSPTEKFGLILIPSSSFCLLTTDQQMTSALKVISKWLTKGGKFVFEIETLKAKSESQGVWKGKWINKPDGSKIVLNTLSHFDVFSQVETILCRYELWQENVITETEVEDFRLKLYEINAIEQLLKLQGLKILSKWQAEPYSGKEAQEDDNVILIECVKQ